LQGLGDLSDKPRHPEGFCEPQIPTFAAMMAEQDAHEAKVQLAAKMKEGDVSFDLNHGSQHTTQGEQSPSICRRAEAFRVKKLRQWWAWWDDGSYIEIVIPGWAAFLAVLMTGIIALTLSLN
jgi:hypothetical protein